MTYAGTTQQAFDGAKGFDTNTVLTPEVLSKFAREYQFCIRYVSRKSHRGSNDLTPEEVKNILDSGLALMIVQHVPLANEWRPTAQLGDLYGQRAVEYTKELNIPPKANVWLDFEGIRDSYRNPIHLKNYCNHWFNKVNEAGYTPGIYVGFDSWLTPEQLYYGLHFKHYWKSNSRVQAPAVRGFQMIQHHEMEKHRIGIDEDVIKMDAKQDAETSLPYWVVKS